MSKIYIAEFRLNVEVQFKDDGHNDISDQAYEALEDAGYDLREVEAELIRRPEPRP